MPYHLFFHFQHSCDVFSRFPLKQSLVLSFPSFQSYLFKRKFQNYSKLKLFKIFSFLNIFSIFCNNYILLGKILRYKFSSHTKNVNLKRFDVSVICVVCVLDCLFPSAYPYTLYIPSFTQLRPFFHVFFSFPQNFGVADRFARTQHDCLKAKRFAWIRLESC